MNIDDLVIDTKLKSLDDIRKLYKRKKYTTSDKDSSVNEERDFAVKKIIDKLDSDLKLLSSLNKHITLLDEI